MAAAGQHNHAEAGAAGPTPRRIAALIATTDISGPGRQLVALATELKLHGIEMAIALMSRPGTSTAFAEFARAHGLTCEVIADTGPLDLGAAQRVRAWLDKVRPDVVQTHSYKQTGIVYLLRKSGLRLPWVAFFEGETDKGLRDRVYNKLELAMLGAADRVVVMSELQRQKFLRLGTRVRVVYNSVPRMPATEAHQAPLPSALSARRGTRERPVIGAIGRLSREKGCDVFLESLARLKRRGAAATGVLVGDGGEEAKLRKLAAELGLEDGRDVVFAGRIEDMVGVYAALDLMVIPSRSEGLPSVLLEAMRQDVPVVSTRVGAMIEIAAQTPAALALVPVENPDALADAMERALAQRGDQRARKARLELVEAFSGEVRAQRMLEVYGEALAARGAKGQQRMKIEMMLPTLSAAGMEVMVARMATKLARRGHDVGIACIEAGGPLVAGLAAAGVRCDVLEARGLIGTEWVKRLVRHLRKVRPDVLHLHSGGWLKGAVAGRIARVPRVIYTAHGFVDPEPWQEKAANRAAIPLTDHIVAVSEHLAEHLARSGVPRQRMSVIANGIDCELFRPSERAGARIGGIRRRLDIAESTVLLGIVARLMPIKNHAVLLEAMALARAKGADCGLVLIGDGPLKGELEALAVARSVADRVHFWGLEANVASLYPELDVFVLSSNLEGTSISLLEAMASGVCVLATDVGGNPAVVGDAGVLVAPKRPDLMADAISTLVASPERRRALGAAARKRVEATFSDEAMIAAYERLYGVQRA